MNILRQMVDYALVRHRVLAKLAMGAVGMEEVCDADRYLLSAAKYHGQVEKLLCPVCRRSELVFVSWVYGDNLREASGSARSESEIARLARRYAEFTVHVVEVCCSCRWNHLSRSYRTGRIREGKIAP